MTRKGLLEALLGVAYEDDIVEESAPAAHSTQTATAASTSSATISPSPAVMHLAPAPPAPASTSDSVAGQRLPVPPAAKVENGPDGSLAHDAVKRDYDTGAAVADAPPVGDRRRTTIAVTRVGMLGGLLGLLEEDPDPLDGAGIFGSADGTPATILAPFNDTDAQPNTTAAYADVTEATEWNHRPVSNSQPFADDLKPDAVVEGGQFPQVATTFMPPIAPPLTSDMPEAGEDSATASPFVLPPPPAAPAPPAIDGGQSLRVTATPTRPIAPPLTLDTPEAGEDSATVSPFVLPPPPPPSALPASAAAYRTVAAIGAPQMAAVDLPPPFNLAQLSQDLDSFDLHRRRRALRALLTGQLTYDIISVVANSLGDPESDLRHLALQVLERAPELVSAAMLHGVTFDPDPTIRARAVALAGRNTDPSMVTAVVAHLVEETDENVIADGLDALAALARATDLADSHIDDVCRAVGIIVRRLNGPVRKNIQFLARTVAIGEVTHRLAYENADIRSGAAVLAAESDDNDAQRAVARLVADPDPVVQQFAAASVSRQGTSAHGVTKIATDSGTPSRSSSDDTLVLGLLNALDDPKPTIRTQATDALLRLPKQRVVDAVNELGHLADTAQLTQLLTAATTLSLEASAPALADAIIRVADGPLPKNLHAAALQFSPVCEVGQQWRTADSSAKRCAGTRLVALLEHPQTASIYETLSDARADMRATAAELAAQLNVSDAVADKLILLAATDPSRKVSLAAITALSTASLQARIDAASGAIASIDAEVRTAALGLVAPDEADAAVAILMQALRDDDEHVVRRAATILMEHRVSETLATLWSLVRADTPHRHVIIDVLRTVDEGALRRLSLEALHSSDPVDRVAAIAGLAVLGDWHGNDLAQAMSDVDARVRSAAIDALSQHGREDVDVVALRAMDDPEPLVRARAAATLVGSDEASALKRGLGALDDASQQVREAVAQAVRKRRSAVLIDLLITELDRPSHQAIVEELLATRNDVADRLFDVLASGDQAGPRQVVLMDVLRRAGHVKRLVGELGHHDPAVRKHALRRLAPVVGAEEVAAVADRLSDPDPTVRIEAANLLKCVGGPVALQALREAFASDPSMDVVAAIEQAYRKMTNNG